ncbi:transposase [Shewanella surugensis]|uniref:Transposase n=1 Tax=Shewanella surugensis TaxID=212020 RepID=A0ABT0LIE3_9GAMM|nr:transposase [Shewanella surugensis]MCL1127077.1 transposase [Shewanella surugensis]
MNTKRQYRSYTKEFKEEALGLITEQGYSIQQAVDAILTLKLSLATHLIV